MIVSGIFIILSGVVLANNSRFGNRIVLQNLAHDIALSVRQAQIYGIAVQRCDNTKVAGCNVSNQFNLAYGMHFAQQVDTFELFADLDADGVFDPGETVQATTIASGYRVDDLCTQASGGGPDDCTAADLNIVFRRPEPDACINGFFNPSDDCVSSFGRGKVVLKSNSDDTATIVVESSGQISVQ